PAALSLAKDKEAKVRWGLAGNAAAPQAVLTELAQDKDARVRAASAGNPSTPASSAQKLAGDGEIAGAQMVAARKDLSALSHDTLAKLLANPCSLVRANCAANPSLPLADAAKLADDAAFEVRAALAGNQTASADAGTLFAKLGQDKEHFVRITVA